METVIVVAYLLSKINVVPILVIPPRPVCQHGVGSKKCLDSKFIQAKMVPEVFGARPSAKPILSKSRKNFPEIWLFDQLFLE